MKPEESAVVTIVPHPVRDNAVIDIANDIALNNARIVVRDMIGRELRSEPLPENRTMVVQADDLPTGGYSVELWSNNSVKTRTVLIKD